MIINICIYIYHNYSICIYHELIYNIYIYEFLTHHWHPGGPVVCGHLESGGAAMAHDLRLQPQGAAFRVVPA